MIRYVSKNQLLKVIRGEDTRTDNFVAQDNKKYIACDNTTGDALTEEFLTLWGAIRWLTLPQIKLKKRSELLNSVLNEELTFEKGITIDI